MYLNVNSVPIRSLRVFNFAAVTAGMVILAAVATSVVPREARALPSFARQTGQPCASCHTAFPELTPFGRRFKLGGYTLRGGDNKPLGTEKDWVPPIAFMAVPTFTHTQKNVAPGDNAPYADNDNLILQEFSVFYGGAITDNIGAFIQTTVDSSGRYAWDNADIRFANTGKIFGTDVLYGITVNNNPTVQDVWHTTPAWGLPFMGPDLGYGPAASTMLEGMFEMQVGSVGAYAFFNDMVYVELSGYKTLSPQTLRDLGVDPTGTSAISGVAPYWRVAVEPVWGNNSWEFGTFGMVADVVPQRMVGFGVDKITDIGVDTQYQYIDDKNAITALVSYIHEHQQLNASANPGLGFASNKSDHLDSWRASVSYVYDRVWSFQAGYFNISGNADAALYGTLTGSPNSDGEFFDIAYLPFSKGGPPFWPWFNVRLGVHYTMYNSFDGGTNNYDGAGRNASDNNTLLLYAWMMW